ncbi:MAG TPA: hypothetical protein VM737_02740 [Gemmatimonadota bacterium]|nr:hypothetical protein [Gemmatimonadota bacterium]
MSVPRLTFVIGLAAALSCSSGNGLAPTDSDPTLGTIELGRDFEIRVGERVEVGEDGLAILFREVREDSRCPVDVDCIWEGDAAVVLEVTIGRRSAEVIALHTTLEPKAVVHADHEIRLVQLDPDPLSTEPIRQRSYVATLSVNRGG